MLYSKNAPNYDYFDIDFYKPNKSLKYKST